MLHEKVFALSKCCLSSTPHMLHTINVVRGNMKTIGNPYFLRLAKKMLMNESALQDGPQNYLEHIN